MDNSDYLIRRAVQDLQDAKDGLIAYRSAIADIVSEDTLFILECAIKDTENTIEKLYKPN